MENGIGALPSNHSQEAKLAAVEVASSRETPCHKVDYWGWGARVEAKESFEGNLVVVIECIKFSFSKDEGCEAAEQNWEAVELVYSETGSRVAKVPSGQPCWQHSA